jgi:hypothetical protein
VHADAWGSGDRSDHRYDEYKGPVFGGFGGSEGAACRVYAPGGKVGETTFFPVSPYIHGCLRVLFQPGPLFLVHPAREACTCMARANTNNHFPLFIFTWYRYSYIQTAPQVAAPGGSGQSKMFPCPALRGTEWLNAPLYLRQEERRGGEERKDEKEEEISILV